jgi:hypothetical protein
LETAKQLGEQEKMWRLQRNYQRVIFGRNSSPFHIWNRG